MWVKLLLLTFYFNGRLHAVSVGKPSKWMSNFWTVRFLSTESEPNFSFPHIPTTRQPGFDLPRQQWSLLNRFCMKQGHCRACRRKWRLTDICVLMARPRRCLTLSNTVPWQNWTAAYLGYTLHIKMLFRGWPVMVHEMHMRRIETFCHILGVDFGI